jgi:hypothetical protein
MKTAQVIVAVAGVAKRLAGGQRLVLCDPAALERDAVNVRQVLLLRVDAEIDNVVGAEPCDAAGIKGRRHSEQPGLQ